MFVAAFSVAGKPHVTFIAILLERLKVVQGDSCKSSWEQLESKEIDFLSGLTL